MNDKKIYIGLGFLGLVLLALYVRGKNNTNNNSNKITDSSNRETNLDDTNLDDTNVGGGGMTGGGGLTGGSTGGGSGNTGGGIRVMGGGSGSGSGITSGGSSGSGSGGGIRVFNPNFDYISTPPIREIGTIQNIKAIPVKESLLQLSEAEEIPSDFMLTDEYNQSVKDAVREPKIESVLFSGFTTLKKENNFY